MAVAQSEDLTQRLIPDNRDEDSQDPSLSTTRRPLEEHAAPLPYTVRDPNQQAERMPQSDVGFVLPASVSQRVLLSSEKKYLKMRRYLTLSVLLACCLTLLLLALVVILINSYVEARNSGDETPSPFQDSFSFFHLSDFHTDLYFIPSISSKLFCRIDNTTPIAAPFNAPFGRVGCDSSRQLIDSVVGSMRQAYNESTGSKIKFIIVSGDMSAHRLDKIAPFSLAPDRTLEAIKYTSDVIASNFSGIPFYPCIGNNDLPGDYRVPENETFYRKLLEIWSAKIICSKCSFVGSTSEDLNSTFLRGGYYKVQLNDKLGLLVMNTVYWSTRVVPQEPIELAIAHEQMTWVKKNLETAFSQGFKLILLGHIPPGVDSYSGKPFWTSEYTEKYVAMVASVYKNQVAAQLFGHLHKDLVSIQRSDEFPHTQKGDMGAVFLAPAVSPVYRNNPAYRVVKATQQGAIIDYVQHHMDLVLSTQHKVPLWRKEYSFRNAYRELITREETISPVVLARLVSALVDPNATEAIWQTYNSHRQTGYQLDPLGRFVVYCSALHVSEKAYLNCMRTHNVTGG